MAAIGVLGARRATAGADTRTVQVQLLQAGFPPGPVDGIYGPETRAALVSFQTAGGLPVTGIVDEATVRRLAVFVILLGTEEIVPEQNATIEPAGDDVEVDEVFSAAEADSPHVRFAAVRVLGAMRSTRSRAVLGVVLNQNAIPAVRSAAARELGALGDALALYALALALDTESDPAVRETIVGELDRCLSTKPLVLPVPVAPAPEMAAPRALVAIAGPLEAAGSAAAGSGVGMLVRTEDPRVFRGRIREGMYVVDVHGDPTRTVSADTFEYRLPGEGPVGELFLLAQEMDRDGHVTTRVYWAPAGNQPIETPRFFVTLAQVE